jgi:GxxExxY protein
MKKLSKKYLDELTCQIIVATIEVHKEMGPGLLESVYEVCMVHELKLRVLSVERQRLLPVYYKGIELHANLRFDLLVENCIVV